MSLPNDAESTLTRRQRESLQVLIKALTDFVVDSKDEHVTESILDYDEETFETRPIDSSIRGPPDEHPKEKLVSVCRVLMHESVMLEYSLRTLGAGGPGMYGAWLLRKNLRAFHNFVRDCDIGELHRPVSVERHAMAIYIDVLPNHLRGLREAFERLKSFMRDFVSLYYSMALEGAFNSLIVSLGQKEAALGKFREISDISPEESRSIRSGLVSFFSELENLFAKCGTELSDFQKQGIPLIQKSQASQSERYLSLTTIATFFSAVTSSTLQIAFQNVQDSNNEALNSAVNTFFLLSLTFSTASAVQALLAMAWKRSFMCVRPVLSSLPLYFDTGLPVIASHVPESKFAFQWVSKSPLLSLIISGVLFTIGLCLFVFASNMNRAASLSTIAVASLHAIGLIIIAIWFIYEQWKFRKNTEVIGKKLTALSVTIRLLVITFEFWEDRFLAWAKDVSLYVRRLRQMWKMKAGAKHDIECGTSSLEAAKPVSESKDCNGNEPIRSPSMPFLPQWSGPADTLERHEGHDAYWQDDYDAGSVAPEIEIEPPSDTESDDEEAVPNNTSVEVSADDVPFPSTFQERGFYTSTRTILGSDFVQEPTSSVSSVSRSSAEALGNVGSLTSTDRPVRFQAIGAVLRSIFVQDPTPGAVLAESSTSEAAPYSQIDGHLASGPFVIEAMRQSSISSMELREH